MDRDDPVTVDFVFPMESEGLIEPRKPVAGVSHLGRCTGCGGEKYILANEMSGNKVKGVRPSRMYECADCGTYRLG